MFQEAGDTLTNTLPINLGIRQRDVTPFLFNVVMNLRGMKGYKLGNREFKIISEYIE